MTRADTLALFGGPPAVPAAPAMPTWPQGTQHDAEALARVVESGAWGSNVGTEVHRFETEIARLQGAERAVATVNGTMALVAALHAVGVGLGDEVIVPAYTFIATAAAPLMLGAIPIFADVRLDDHNIDPASVESRVTERTAAVIPVHLAGKPADMDRLTAVTGTHCLAVVEDAAQAAGASYNGRRVGAIGDVGTLSFQSSKNLTCGEGGVMVTNDDAVAAALYSYVNVGRVPGGGWYEHRTLGYNLRMTEFQGALLREQLRSFPAHQERRDRAARRLDSLLAAVDGVLLPSPDPGTTEHGRHLYLMRAPELAAAGTRDAAVDALRAEGVSGAFTGYVPLHRSAAIVEAAEMLAARLGQPYERQECPATDRLCAETIWLDQKTLLADDAQLDGVAAAIGKVVGAGTALRAAASAGGAA